MTINKMQVLFINTGLSQYYPAQRNKIAIQKQSLDSAKEFFMQLGSCTPNSCYGRNIISDTYGTQQISGMNDGVYSIILSTSNRHYLELLICKK